MRHSFVKIFRILIEEKKYLLTVQNSNGDTHFILRSELTNSCALRSFFHFTVVSIKTLFSDSILGASVPSSEWGFLCRKFYKKKPTLISVTCEKLRCILCYRTSTWIFLSHVYYFILMLFQWWSITNDDKILKPVVTTGLF